MTPSQSLRSDTPRPLASLAHPLPQARARSHTQPHTLTDSIADPLTHTQPSPHLHAAGTRPPARPHSACTRLNSRTHTRFRPPARPMGCSLAFPAETKSAWRTGTRMRGLTRSARQGHPRTRWVGPGGRVSLCVCVRYCASTKALSYQRSWQSVQLFPIFPSPHGRAIREEWGRLLLVVRMRFRWLQKRLHNRSKHALARGAATGSARCAGQPIRSRVAVRAR